MTNFSIFSKRRFFIAFFIIFSLSLFAQPVPGSYYDFIDATKDMSVTHDKQKLIIYRPENNGAMNDIRCFLRLEDENGNDVTYTSATATYEWVNIPDIPNLYKKNYYLSGGMAMHLSLKKGKYKISFYTPKDKQNNFTYPVVGTKPFEWSSNVFEYNTENPTKVIFLTATTNDNGFYNGGWKIDYKE